MAPSNGTYSPLIAVVVSFVTSGGCRATHQAGSPVAPAQTISCFGTPSSSVQVRHNLIHFDAPLNFDSQRIHRSRMAHSNFSSPSTNPTRTSHPQSSSSRECSTPMSTPMVNSVSIYYKTAGLQRTTLPPSSPLSKACSTTQTQTAPQTQKQQDYTGRT
jgi:hypothetical protein